MIWCLSFNLNSEKVFNVKKYKVILIYLIRNYPQARVFVWNDILLKAHFNLCHKKIFASQNIYVNQNI